MTDNATAAQIRSYVARVLRLREEIAALNADVSEVYKEAVGNGFDKKTLQATVKRAAQAPEAVEEQDTLLDLYWRAWVTGGDDARPSRARARESVSITPHDPETGEVIEPAVTEQQPASTDAAGLNSTSAPASGDDPGLSSRAPHPCGAGEGDRPMRAALPNPIPSAPSPGSNGGRPCEPSPDAVPAADDTTPHTASSDSGQSERAPETTYDLDVPAFLKRDPATNRAPYMDRSAAE